MVDASGVGVAHCFEHVPRVAFVFGLPHPFGYYIVFGGAWTHTGALLGVLKPGSFGKLC